MIIATMDFMVNASNVYRTKDFIVKQEIHIGTDGYDTNQVVSVDTYYKRTPEREVAYKALLRIGNESMVNVCRPRCTHARI